MFFSLSYKAKQFFFVLIKLSIVAGAFYFIYTKLVNNSDLSFNDFIQFLTKNDVFSTKNIFFLLFLTIFNWFLEILKWRKLISSIKKITFINALEQSLGSLTASLFTPNRIGEYGAKAVYYSLIFRKQIVLLNLLGNIMQMSITVIFGVIGLAFFVIQNNIDLNYYKIASLFTMILIIISLIGFGVKKTSFRVKNYSIKKIIGFIKDLPTNIHVYSFVYSLLRYVVFSFQFYYLLLIFGVDISYVNAMIVISSMYILSSVIPTIFIFDVVVKGSIAIYLFSIIGVNELTVLSIITLMWLLNFVLPSVFGSFYVLNFNLPENDTK